MALSTFPTRPNGSFSYLVIEGGDAPESTDVQWVYSAAVPARVLSALAVLRITGGYRHSSGAGNKIVRARLSRSADPTDDDAFLIDASAQGTSAIQYSLHFMVSADGTQVVHRAQYGTVSSYGDPRTIPDTPLYLHIGISVANVPTVGTFDPILIEVFEGKVKAFDFQ